MLTATPAGPPFDLRELHLRDVDVNADDVVALLRRCPRLEFVGLENLPRIGEGALAAALGALPLDRALPQIEAREWHLNDSDRAALSSRPGPGVRFT